MHLDGDVGKTRRETLREKKTKGMNEFKKKLVSRGEHVVDSCGSRLLPSWVDPIPSLLKTRRSTWDEIQG
jgi:hypothetical protein